MHNAAFDVTTRGLGNGQMVTRKCDVEALGNVGFPGTGKNLCWSA